MNELFPFGYNDEHEQQIDMRKENSWVQTLDQISTVEVVEVFAVNIISVNIINSKLRNLMAQTEGDKFIINVSSPEGKFNTMKGVHHPHTNQAKVLIKINV